MWIMFKNKQKLSTKLELIIEADWLIFIVMASPGAPVYLL